MAWERNDKLQLAGIIIAVLAVAIGAVVAIMPSQVGCLTRLAACPADKAAAHGHVASSDHPTVPRPSDVTPGILAAPADSDLPFPVQAPAPSGRPAHLAVALSPQAIINRGTFAAIKVTGSGFTAGNNAQISWTRPDGATYEETSLPVTNTGTFEQALFWYPLRGLGIAGNDGSWQIAVKDMATGKLVKTSYRVSSNAKTPPPDQWPPSYDVPPSGPAAVDVRTYGTLCARPGELVQVDVSGFAPSAALSVYYLRPDGEYVMAQGELADALGQVNSIQSYWQTQACQPGKVFRYTVLVSDDDTGRRARVPLILTVG